MPETLHSPTKMASNQVDHQSSVSASSSSITVPVDRSSSLPESLISHILSSLATKEAVATSILSHSWRFRWTHLTSFNFENSSERSLQFVDFIDGVMLKHSGESIDNFVLVWRSADFKLASVGRWVELAINRNVRVLDLHMYPKSIAALQCEFTLPFSSDIGALETNNELFQSLLKFLVSLF